MRAVPSERSGSGKIVDTRHRGRRPPETSKDVPLPPRLSISHSSTGDGVAVVIVRGEIDHTTGDALRQALVTAEVVGTPRTVVDLSGVTFMDSSGVNILVAAHQAARRARGWLRLAAPQQPVERLLRLVGIDEVIPCHATLDEALDS